MVRVQLNGEQEKIKGRSPHRYIKHEFQQALGSWTSSEDKISPISSFDDLKTPSFLWQ